MADTKEGSPKTYEMRAFFTEEDHEALLTGEAVSNNGFRSKDGSFWPNQPNFEEIDEFEESSEYNGEAAVKVAIVAGIGVVAFVAGHMASPYIKRWWNDKAVPGIKKTWSRITGKEESMQSADDGDNSRVDTTEIAFANGITPIEFSKKIDVTFEEYRANMSSEEAQRHLINIAMLAALLADEIRRLSNACIKEGGEVPDNYLEWQNAIEKLTTQKVTDSINLILENNVSLLEEDTSKTLSKILGVSLNTDGMFVPIKNDRLKEALSLKSICADKENRKIYLNTCVKHTNTM